MLLLSIRPRFVDSILAGEKRVELRRKCPRVNCRQAIIYATSPRMELVATFRIESIIKGSLPMLWQSVRGRAGVTRQEFDRYFMGLAAGVGIEIGAVVQFDPVPLDDLRTAWEGFHPPQGFRYLDRSDLNRVAGLRRLVA
jgi:predicted transcriptional regulator